MAYRVRVKGGDKKRAVELMKKTLELFADDIEGIDGPYDVIPTKIRQLPTSLIKTKEALVKTYDEKKRPVSVHEVREVLGLSRNLVSGYLNSLVKEGYAKKVPNTYDVEKANKLFEPI